MQAGTRLTRFASALLLAPLVSACGGPSEPLEAEIADAVRAVWKQADPGQQINKLHSAKKFGCKKDGDRAFKCDVELNMTTILGPNKQGVAIRLVKGDKGWVAIADR